MTATLVSDTLSITLFHRGFPERVIVHSGHGSQYCSKGYRELISAYNLKQSIDRKGKLLGQRYIESFFHAMKVEAVLHELIMSRE